jgi:hypothetical protein
MFESLKIRAIIDTPHLLVCRKRRLNWGGPSDKKAHFTAGVAR